MVHILDQIVEGTCGPLIEPRLCFKSISGTFFDKPSTPCVWWFCCFCCLGGGVKCGPLIHPIEGECGPLIDPTTYIYIYIQQRPRRLQPKKCKKCNFSGAFKESRDRAGATATCRSGLSWCFPMNLRPKDLLEVIVFYQFSFATCFDRLNWVSWILGACWIKYF